MCNSAAHNNRPNRESVRKQIGIVAARLIDARDGGACVYCGATAETSGRHLHLDHLVPRAAGGENDLDNLVTACHRCNSARQDLPLAAWARKAARDFGLKFASRAIRAHARRIAA